MLPKARFARAYGFNPNELTSQEFKGLLDCLPEIYAEEELRYRRYQAPLTPERIKRLIYLTTYDVDKAESAEAWQWLRNQKINSQKPTIKVPKIPTAE